MISQTSSYAIYALTCLEGPEGSYKLVKAVAEQASVPAPYLAKIFNTLRRRGIIQAQRGVGGGVKLNKEAKDISLYTICEATEDPFLDDKCLFGLAECLDEAACPGHEFWKTEKPKIQDLLRNTTIVDTAESLLKKGIVLK